MIIKTRSAGDILDANCTRCRILTNHTIVAMVEGRVARVKCNTCGSEHRYHPPKEEKNSPPRRSAAPAGRSPSAAPAKKDSAPAYREQWESAMAGKEPAQAKEYDMAGVFRKDDLVRHSLFGLGIVVSVTGTKMELLFADGPKLLRCGK